MKLIHLFIKKGGMNSLVYIKRIPLAFILVLSIVMITGCSTDTNANEQNGGEAWAAENKLDETEPVDELYEKAKEEGSVVIYSNGSKFKDVKASFEEEYPGVKVEPYKVTRAELVEKLTREHESGVYNADVIHTNPEPKLLDNSHMHSYLPHDIRETYFEEYQDDEYPIHYMDVNPIIYNTEVYDESPVTNWWDLTDPEWTGKVLMQDPVSDVSYSELFIAIIQHADEMEEAYKDKYGEEIELKEENAGYEFIKRFIENDPVLISSGEDIIDSVGQTGQENPPIGFTSSSKLRHIKQSGLPIEGNLELNPKVSVMRTKGLYVADQAEHPNAAKLMIRWALGEANGEAAGLDPFNLYGVWIPRDNVENKNDISMEDIETWHIDQEFYDTNFSEFRNFWLSNID